METRDPYQLGYAFRGRLETNWADPQEVWACPDCGALVQTTDLVAHVDWHATRDR